MTWSYVAQASGSSSAASFSPTWPAGVQDGDLLTWCALIVNDTGGQSITAAAPGWMQQGAFGDPARMMAAAYSASLALPTITLTNDATCHWWIVALRGASAPQLGGFAAADGSPPAASSLTVPANAVVLLFGSAVGDQGVGWTITGSFAQLVNQSGAGSGNASYPNAYIGWLAQASPATLTNLRAYLAANRYYLVQAAEGGGGAVMLLI